MLDRANSIYIPTGRWPVRGWLLVARADYDELEIYSDALQLNVGNTRAQNNVGTLKNLSVVQAQCVTRGLEGDLNAIYLVEVTDDRGILDNRWFQAPLATQYNVRAPAYPDTFHPASMNGGTTWTWATMLADMWGRLATLDGGAVLGPWPGLPAGVAPAGTPEGFWFTGVPGWCALVDVLEHLGLTVACDLTQDAPYTVVIAGAEDAALDALQDKYTTNLEDDEENIDAGAGRVPRTVTVMFRRRNAVYGTEETVRRDGPQWDMAAYYQVVVGAPAAFINAGAVGSHHLWSDYTVRYDQDGSPISADVATTQQIALERVTQYFAKIYRGTYGMMSRTYAGALPFTTGPQVDGVCYYQDYRGNSRQGWRTKIVRGACPPFVGIWDVV